MTASNERKADSSPDNITINPKDASLAPQEYNVAHNSAVSSDVDDNYDLYARQHGAEVDPTLAKKVLRRIDLRLMPILFLIYLLQYLDKNSINFASVYGLKKGTGLKGQDYSWLGKDSSRILEILTVETLRRTALLLIGTLDQL